MTKITPIATAFIILQALFTVSKAQAKQALITNPYNSFSDVANDIQANLSNSAFYGLNIKYLEQFYGVPKTIDSEHEVTMKIEGCDVELTTNKLGAITAFSINPNKKECFFNLRAAGRDKKFTKTFQQLKFKDVLRRFPYSDDGRTAFISTPCINCGNAFEPYSIYHYATPHVAGFVQLQFTISQPSYFELWDKEDSVTDIEINNVAIKNGLDENVQRIRVGYNLFKFREH